MPRIQHKRGTSANLASVNPTPLAGELVWDSTENAIKFGDGATAWTSLAYVTATPRTHTHSADAITSGTVAYARLPVGSTTSTVCAGDDARLSDARTPTAHKASHATGGSDALTPGDIGAAPAASPTFTGTATFGQVSFLTFSLADGATLGDFPDNVVTPYIFTTNGAGSDFGGQAGHLVLQPRTNANRDIIFAGGSPTTSELVRIVGGSGRVGIGRTSPATALDVNGVITVSAGSAAAPALTISGDSDSGFYQASANLVGIAAAGQPVVEFQYTSAPIVRLGGVTANTNVSVVAPNASGTNQAGGNLAIGGSQGTGTGEGGRIDLSTASAGGSSGTAINARAVRMQVKSNGTVRFVPMASDPTAGSAAGDVYYNSASNELRYHNGSAFVGAAPAVNPAFTGAATFANTGNVVPLTVTNTGTGNSFVVNDAAGDATPFVVDASGNVGIWNSTPLAAIDASFASDSIPGSGFCGMRLHRSGSSTTAFSCGIMLTARDDNGGIIAADGAQNIRFFNYTGSSIAERVRIDSSGNLLVGTTTASSRLTVNGVITVSATSGSAGSYAPSLTISGDSNTGFGQVSGQSDSASVFTAGHERVRVRSDGNVGVGYSGAATHRFGVSGDISGTGSNIIILGAGTAAAAATQVYAFYSSPSVGASASLSVLTHYSAVQGTVSGTVTAQTGYACGDLTAATNNYGFRSAVSSATGRWNFYAEGTAPNYFAGNVGIGSGTTSPTAALDINADKIRLRTAKTPASASATGNAGDICWDASYLYICTATNTWRRIAHSTW